MEYYRYSDYLKKRFGERVRKISVDAGFSCPNRDGKLSNSGCIYCDNKAFSFQAMTGKSLPLEEQIRSGMEQAKRRFKAKKFIIYFQAYTNTYDSAERLKSRFDIIRQFKGVVALSIATRPDCVDREKLDLISSYAKDYEVWIEYGLQSVHDNTLEFINRGHNYNDFLKAYFLTREYPIKICAHIILGLPHETEAMMMKTAKEMARIEIDAIKIHPLHVVKETALEELYKKGEYTPLDIDEYRRLLKEFLRRIPPGTIIQRLSAYCPEQILVAPSWIRERHVF
jgi:uncharacterized protein